MKVELTNDEITSAVAHWVAKTVPGMAGKKGRITFEFRIAIAGPEGAEMSAEVKDMAARIELLAETGAVEEPTK